MYIGVLPYMQRNQKNLGAVSVSSLLWLDNNKPNVELLGHLEPEDQIVVYPYSKHMLFGFGDIRCQVNLLLAEPRSIHRKYYSILPFLLMRYKRIMCRYPDLAARYDRVICFNSAETWVKPEDVDAHPIFQKRKLCSIIASAKKDLPGHQLRHQLVEGIREKSLPIDILGRGYHPFEYKWQGLLPYRYSVIIENDIEPHYFTEKILDAFVCGTIPIYWGTGNIGEYFDDEGIIQCQSFSAIMNMLENLPEYPSESLLAAAERNRLLVSNYVNQPQRIATALYKELVKD